MEAEPLACKKCGISLDARQLVSKTTISSKTITFEDCPKCGTTLNTSTKSFFTDLTATIAGDVGEIDSWLDNYATETANQIVKRETSDDCGFLWTVGTQYGDFACECYYDQKHTGSIEIRMVTKKQADIVVEKWNELFDLATKVAIQPYANHQSGWDRSDGSYTDAVWGMVQYVDVNSLNSSLLISVTKRLNDAMQFATTEILGNAQK